MTELSSNLWFERLNYLDYALQPIINIYSGECYEYEALLRNTDKAGFDSIDAFFDKAFKDTRSFFIS